MPLTKTLPAFVCGACDNDTFLLAEKDNLLIAICSCCKNPVVNLGCGCLDNKLV